jgi:putative membrane protein
MFLKGLVLRFFTYIAIAYIVTIFIKGFNFNSPSTLFLFAFVLSISFFTIEPVIKFLTFPVNFLTFGLFSFVISSCLLYFFSSVIPGFKVTEGSIGPFSNSLIQIPRISLSHIGVIVISSIIISFLNNLISWTQD